jgi:hypothetical protein
MLYKDCRTLTLPRGISEVQRHERSISWPDLIASGDQGCEVCSILVVAFYKLKGIKSANDDYFANVADPNSGALSITSTTDPKTRLRILIAQYDRFDLRPWLEVISYRGMLIEHISLNQCNG